MKLAAPYLVVLAILTAGAERSIAKERMDSSNDERGKWAEALSGDPVPAIRSLRERLAHALDRFPELERDATASVVRWERSNWTRCDFEPFESERRAYPRPKRLADSIGDQQGSYRAGFDSQGRVRIQYDFARTFVPVENQGDWTAKTIVEYREDATLVWAFSHDHPNAPRQVQYVDLYPLGASGRLLGQIHVIQTEDWMIKRGGGGSTVSAYEWDGDRLVTLVERRFGPDDRLSAEQPTPARYVHDDAGLTQIVSSHLDGSPWVHYRRPAPDQTLDRMTADLESMLRQLVPQAVTGRASDRVTSADPIEAVMLTYDEAHLPPWIGFRTRRETEKLAAAGTDLWNPAEFDNYGSISDWIPPDPARVAFFEVFEQELTLHDEAWRIPLALIRVSKALNESRRPALERVPATDRMVVCPIGYDDGRLELNRRLSVPASLLAKHGIRLTWKQRLETWWMRRQLRI